MTFAPLEVQKEIYLALAQDADIIDALGGDSGTDSISTKVFDFVPDNTITPYITIFVLPFTDRANATYEGFSAEVQINVHYRPGEGSNLARGNRPVYLIQEKIDTVLHKKELCIDGWNTLQMRRSLITIETDVDNVTKHGIQRFNLLIGEK